MKIRKLTMMLVTVVLVAGIAYAGGSQVKPLNEGDNSTEPELRIRNYMRDGKGYHKKVAKQVAELGGIDNMTNRRWFISAFAQHMVPDSYVEKRVGYQSYRFGMTYTHETGNPKLKPYVTYIFVSWGQRNIVKRHKAIKWDGGVLVEKPATVSRAAVYGFRKVPVPKRGVDYNKSVKRVKKWDAITTSGRDAIIVRIESTEPITKGKVKVGRYMFNFETVPDANVKAKMEAEAEAKAKAEAKAEAKDDKAKSEAEAEGKAQADAPKTAD